jgi:hypothetical protein
MIMWATSDSLRLRRRRRIVCSIIVVFFLGGILLETLGFKGAGSVAFVLILLTLIDVLVLGYGIRRAEREQAKLLGKGEVTLPPYWKIVAGNLIFSAFVLLLCRTSALLAAPAALIVMGVLLPMAISAGKGSVALRRQRWTRFLIYAIAVAAGWALDHQASVKEQRNFDAIIAAVEHYQAAEHRYPRTLMELVPSELAAVPPGRFGTFSYWSDTPDDACLSHMPMPFVHETYDFKAKSRRSWD